jgi:hypothetical protein
MNSMPCPYCGNEIPFAWSYCPHCARPGLFPNVKAAQAEKQALERRYQLALRDASIRGVATEVRKFEAAVTNSKAVITRSLRDLDRLAASDKELFPTFYRLLGEEPRLPHGNQWDLLRRMADEALFPGYKGEIRFATLSLDGTAGLGSYGECSFVLRNDMIAHRTSVFEENSALYLRRHGYEPEPGHRATWEERAKLCVAKFAHEIVPGISETDFPKLLLQPGITSDEDNFVEVHIWGPLTLRTVERILIPTPRKKASRKALRDRLEGLDVMLEEIA